MNTAPHKHDYQNQRRIVLILYMVPQNSIKEPGYATPILYAGGIGLKTA